MARRTSRDRGRRPPTPPTPKVVSEPPTPTVTGETRTERERRLRRTQRGVQELTPAPVEQVTLQEQMRQDREFRIRELVTAGYSPHEAFRLGQFNPASALGLAGRTQPSLGAIGQPTSLELYYQDIMQRTTGAYETDLRTRFEHRGGYGEYHPGGADPRLRKEHQFGIWPGLQAPSVPDDLPWEDPGVGAPKRYRARGGGTSRGAASPSYFSLGLINWRIGL